MQNVLSSDLLLTIALSTFLVGGGVMTLWLLPWTDAERAGTTRAFGQAVRRSEALAARLRTPLRALVAAR